MAFLKKFYPHLIFLVLFAGISNIYFFPVRQGKVLDQHDIKMAIGMGKEAQDYYEKSGEPTAWTNSMFGGMPTYQINYPTDGNKFRFVFSTLVYKIYKDPTSTLIILMIALYIMLLCFKVDYRIAGIISIAYGLTTFNVISIGAGHANKMWALMFAPLVPAGLELLFNRKWALGIAVTALGTGLEMYAGHPQITYYLGIALIPYLIVKIIFAIKENTLIDFAKAAAIGLIIGIAGVATNANSLLTTYEYGKETTRGESELVKLAPADQGEAGGLPYDYAFSWSNGFFEPLTLWVPNFYGGGANSSFNFNKLESYKMLKSSQGAKEAEKIVAAYLYWGDQPFTAGAYYFGVIFMFLFVLGIFILPNSGIKWWLISATVLTILLSMGKNFSILSDLFFYYFPMYNKFRTVTMFMGIAQILIAVMSALTLKELITRINSQEIIKKLFLSFYISGGLLLLLAIAGPIFFSFSGANDAEVFGTNTSFIDAFVSDRKSIMRMDAFRSLFFVAAAFGILWAILKDKFKAKFAIPVLGLLMFIDIILVDTRYITYDSFKPKKNVDANFTPSNADLEILKDTDPNYRVLNLSSNIFNDATTSYFHKSIGGYHGAKLKRYQQLIENVLYSEIQVLQSSFSMGSMDSITANFAKLKAINMLNTKYFIVPGQNNVSFPIRNPYALGNAWFISNPVIVEDADAELGNIRNADFNPAQTAFINKKYAEFVNNFKPGIDSSASIRLKSYKPNELIYESQSSIEQIAIFSEIYYPYGWNVTIDGQSVESFRANFVLRALRVPAGKHEIIFKFLPESVVKGEKISSISSVALLLIAAVALGFGLFQEFKNKEEK